MKKNRGFVVASVFMLFLLLIVSQTKLISHPNQPDAGYVNDPDPSGAATCANSGCHSGTAVADSTKFIVKMGLFSAGTGAQDTVVSGVSTYYADSVYYMTVTATGTSPRYGFELTVIDGSPTPGNMAGAIALTSTTTTTLGTYHPSGSTVRQYVGHKNAGTNKTWTFKWTAPHTNLGPLTIYYCGMNSNANGNESGDQVYKSTRILTEATPVVSGIESIDSKVNALSVYPTVTSSNFNVSFNLLNNAPVKAEVMDMNGNVVSELMNEGMAQGLVNRQFDAGNLAAGVYLVKLQVGNAATVRKIVKL